MDEKVLHNAWYSEEAEGLWLLLVILAIFRVCVLLPCLSLVKFPRVTPIHCHWAWQALFPLPLSSPPAGLNAFPGPCTPVLSTSVSTCSRKTLGEPHNAPSTFFPQAAKVQTQFARIHKGTGSGREWLHSFMSLKCLFFVSCLVTCRDLERHHTFSSISHHLIIYPPAS